MKKVKFAVTGYGHIGKRHVEMILRNQESELVAVIDIRSKEDTGFTMDTPYFNSLELFLASGIECDVVTIATPNGYHSQQAIQVLNARFHVVIEKPMALNKQDAESVIHKSLEVNRYVFNVMQNRYSPPSVWLKELIKSGKLGKIYLAELNCYWNRDNRYYTNGNWHGTQLLDGGTLFTQFSHFIDLLYWTLGDIKNISAKHYNFNHAQLTEFDDSGIINFEFNQGGAGVITYSTSVWDTNLESSLTIIAENGSIKIGGQYMDKLLHCHIKDYELPELAPTNPGNDYGTYKGSAQNHHYVIDNVVRVIGRNEAISTNALEGLKVVDIIERIYNSQ